ncbi:hypothetical protein MXF13_05120 [Leclercia adecarboxylata]|uniref:hypothetical protein n=1 Tax=Leclercia TaxID=83654 RepID=UPI0013315427|nr:MULTISPECIES: hypothetical protein [Leclercia]MEB5749273.1 hypothetical protein [Leclercia adecarboxylata]URM24282.1 hypothetical protein JJN11_07165 [Leclercia adecarboxylata]UYM56758.1 hypothetical protein N5937_05500 [Leclercia adecarboxylata]
MVDDGSLSVERSMPIKGVLMLLTSERVQVFEPKAFILYRHNIENIKDIIQSAFFAQRIRA